MPWTAIGLTSLPSGGGPAPAADQVLVDPSRGVIAVGASVTGTIRATFYRPASGRIGALASTAEPDDSAGTVIIVDPVGGPHAPRQVVVADLDAAVAAALAVPGPDAGPGPDVEIRLETNDRLAAPAPMTAAPPVSRWRIVAPTGLTPVIEGDLTIDLPGASVEIAGCYLDGNLTAGAEPGRADADRDHHEPGRRAHPVGRAGRVDAAAVRVPVPPGYRSGPTSAPSRSSWPTALSTGRAWRSARAVPRPPRRHRCPPWPRPTGSRPSSRPPACTFAGPVAVDTIQASDCLFGGGIRTVVTSAGCLRFSHLGDQDDPAAHPPAHQCLTGPLPTMMSSGAESVGYYAPLLADPGARGADPVLTGASDGGEIGAYHHAQRGPLALQLAQRLAEMTPAHGAPAPDRFPPGGMT